MSRKTRFLRIIDDRIHTLNLVKGVSVYSEKLVELDGREYRSFTPMRSKLAAVIKKGADIGDITPDAKMLYLGAANGTTVSHLSDMMPDGKIFAVEISRRSFRDLVELAERRANILPILADASKVGTYRYIVGQVDVIYQDVSQKEQVGIFRSNADVFLRPGGTAYFMVKANCIESTRPSNEVFEIVRKELIGAGFIIREAIDLYPHQKDHMAFILQKN